MAIESFNMLDILWYVGLLLDPPWLVQDKLLKMLVLKRLENTILRLVSANAVFHKRAVLLIC